MLARKEIIKRAENELRDLIEDRIRHDSVLLEGLGHKNGEWLVTFSFLEKQLPSDDVNAFLKQFPYKLAKTYKTIVMTDNGEFVRMEDYQ